jgi:hypothetical protein
MLPWFNRPPGCGFAVPRGAVVADGKRNLSSCAARWGSHGQYLFRGTRSTTRIPADAIRTVASLHRGSTSPPQDAANATIEIFSGFSPRRRTLPKTNPARAGDREPISDTRKIKRAGFAAKSQILPDSRPTFPSRLAVSRDDERGSIDLHQLTPTLGNSRNCQNSCVDGPPPQVTARYGCIKFRTPTDHPPSIPCGSARGIRIVGPNWPPHPG